MLRLGNALIPVEQKPSARRLQPSHILQVAAQCLLVEEAYGVRPPYGVVALSGGIIAGAGAVANAFVQPGGYGNPMVQATLASGDVTVTGAIGLSSVLNAAADATAASRSAVISEA